MTEININFDVRDDASGGDPDSTSPTLRRYHQLLWSKRLPDGRELNLRDTPLRASSSFYIYAHVDDGTEQTWGSDSFLATHTKWIRMAHIMDQVPESVKEDFRAAGYTIGGFILWPQNQVENKPTINQARGYSAKVADRMDLTLECVRLYYSDPKSPSPLADVFGRYPEYFALFSDFSGFIEFWLLQDLVLPAGDQVRFFLPFEEFSVPRARTVDEWNIYRRNSMEFCNARNERIARWANAHLESV